jgi:hypothetical protein
MPVPELIMVMPVIAKPVSATRKRSARPDRRRSAVEGKADIDHWQFDACF